jgi:hypothetical protein
MKKDLADFLKNLTIVNKDIVKYADEKGNIIYANINSLYASCTYLELNKSQYEQMVFQQTITPDDYNIVEVKTQTSKYEITKKEEDRFTLVDTTAKVRQVWIVANSLQFSKCFKTKEEAEKLVQEIEDYIENNNKIND